MFNHLKKKPAYTLCLCGFQRSIGDPGGTRTLNPQNRNLIFYPLNYGAGLLAKVIILVGLLMILFCMVFKDAFETFQILMFICFHRIFFNNGLSACLTDFFAQFGRFYKHA